MTCKLSPIPEIEKKRQNTKLEDTISEQDKNTSLNCPYPSIQELWYVLSAVWSRSKFRASVIAHFYKYVMPHIFSNCPCTSRRKKYASSTGWALNRGQRVWRATRTAPARSTSNNTMKCTTYFTTTFTNTTTSWPSTTSIIVNAPITTTTISQQHV